MKEKQLDYRFKAFQFMAEDGPTWMLEYPDIPAVVGGGDTLEEAIKEGKENIEAYFAMLKEEGRPIPQPTMEPEVVDYSGKLVLRLSKSNHRKVALLAEKEGVSINTLLNEMITEGISNKLNNKAVNELIEDLKIEMVTSNNLALNLKHN